MTLINRLMSWPFPLRFLFWGVSAFCLGWWLWHTGSDPQSTAIKPDLDAALQWQTSHTQIWQRQAPPTATSKPETTQNAQTSQALWVAAKANHRPDKALHHLHSPWMVRIQPEQLDIIQAKLGQIHQQNRLTLSQGVLWQHYVYQPDHQAWWRQFQIQTSQLTYDQTQQTLSNQVTTQIKHPDMVTQANALAFDLSTQTLTLQEAVNTRFDPKQTQPDSASPGSKPAPSAPRLQLSPPFSPTPTPL